LVIRQSARARDRGGQRADDLQRWADRYILGCTYPLLIGDDTHADSRGATQMVLSQQLTLERTLTAVLASIWSHELAHACDLLVRSNSRCARPARWAGIQAGAGRRSLTNAPRQHW